MSENGNGKKELVEIFVDGQPVKVLPGINAIEAAKVAGKEIPHYCYHPKLSVVGNRRMCLMEMGTPMRDRETGEPILEEDGSQKIGWIPKPVIGCSTNVSPGMHIKTESDLVKDCREGVMEFLLVNHPLDCPICDQAGECSLQEYAMDYGRGYSRYEERKNVKPKRTRLGPRVTLDDERCVLCSRCIRFGQEIADQDVLGFVDRGSFSTLTCHPNKELDHNYSLTPSTFVQLAHSPALISALRCGFGSSKKAPASVLKAVLERTQQYGAGKALSIGLLLGVTTL